MRSPKIVQDEKSGLSGTGEAGLGFCPQVAAQLDSLGGHLGDPSTRGGFRHISVCVSSWTSSSGRAAECQLRGHRAAAGLLLSGSPEALLRAVSSVRRHLPPQSAHLSFTFRVLFIYLFILKFLFIGGVGGAGDSNRG